MQPQMSTGYELSPQQKQFSEQGRETAVGGSAILLEGETDLDQMRKALGALVARHEILRTRFQRRAGMKFPFQVVEASSELSWDEVDLSSLATAEQNSRIHDFLRHSTQINIEKGPVLHARLAKLGAGRHALVLTFSALCVDDASLNILFSELATLYLGAALPEEVLQYADYSEWQNQWLRKGDEEAKQATQFWKQFQLEASPALSLPFARKGTAGLSAWETVPVEWKLPDGDGFEDFLLASWQAFLWRMTGQPEFIVGYESDGRNHEEFTSGVGVFAKPLALRASLEPEPTFNDLWEATTKRRADAIEWQDYFSPHLMGSRVPVGFAFRDLAEEVTVNGIVISEVARVLPPSGFGLELRCSGRKGSRILALAFNPAYFRRERVEELAGRLNTVIHFAAANPALPVGDLPIITEPERRKVTVEFNQTVARYPQDKCAHQLFEEQVTRGPQRPALRFGENELSYFELNRAANQIAHILRQSGVAPNVPVGLCLERSAEMIVALLGVLKAGGCYVPLLPDNPKARLAHQLSETGAPVVLTQGKHADRLPEFNGKIICLDHDGDMLTSAPDGNPGVEMSPENRVYVIYTSGSTGAPKGVAVRHSNLVNYSHFIGQRLELEKYPEGLHFATVSTIAADLGNTCIFPSLISGGCLHVIGYELAMSPALFAEYASRHPIDVLKITPSHLSTLLDSDAARSVLPRKYLVLGGEAPGWRLIEQVRKSGECAIFNHYGPTEATVGCCTFSVDKADVSEWEPATVPIGRPIANDQVYILDRGMKPVPVGVAGELCVGGAGIAQGYLKQPEQTAERFVPNPFSDDPAARLYRTGDLARFLPDGNIEFLGRIDQQVKIRGFRVEPAEIESVLKRYPGVKQAAIVPYHDKSGEKRLAAYAVTVGRARAEELRAFVAQELPDYMVPAVVVLIDSLPLTANGKLDLRALPSPEQQAPVHEIVTPRTLEEEKLAVIWREVLKLERVGVTDNFFELGGHSLLATQIIARIRNVFHVQMPLQMLLLNPTIAALAEQIGHCPAIESEQQEMARLLQELEGISEEEAEKLLAAELQKDKSGPDS